MRTTPSRTPRQSLDSMYFRPRKAATLRMLTKALSAFKSQNPCSSGPFWTPMESESSRYSSTSIFRSDRTGGGAGHPSGPDQSRVANQEPGDQEGCSRNHPQEIPLQSVSLQL